MALQINVDDVPEIISTPEQADKNARGPSMRVVYGQGASMCVGDRPPGYHSMPHTHDREQFNYALSGEMWLFVDGKAFLTKPGDFTRVPANAVHWAWNASGENCKWIEWHMPGLQDVDMLDTSKVVGLMAEGEADRHVKTPPTIFLPEGKCDWRAIEAAALATGGEPRTTPSLRVNLKDVPEIVSAPKQAEAGAKGPSMYMVHGHGGSMCIGVRPPGYHSMPHVHDREQYNYAITGDMWLFVDGKGYYCRPGDFTRVPANAVHWAWNPIDHGECVWIEFHMPGQQDEKMLGRTDVMPLFEKGQSTDHVQTPPTIFLPESDCDWRTIEAAAVREHKAVA